MGAVLPYTARAVDDMVAIDQTKAGAARTAQGIIIMQAILNIRVQGTKSITIFSKACVAKIMRLVRRWYGTNFDLADLPLSEIDLFSGMPGRTLTQDNQETIPVILTKKSTKTNETLTMAIQRVSSSDPWGFTKNDTSNILSVFPNTPASTGGLREGDCITNIGDYTAATLTLSVTIQRANDVWLSTTPNGSKTTIDLSEALRQASTHAAFAIEVITLNTEGVLGPAQFSPRVPMSQTLTETLTPSKSLEQQPKKTKTTKSAEPLSLGISGDDAKYLGVMISLYQGTTSQYQKLTAHMWRASTEATFICQSTDELRTLSGTIMSNLDFSLSAVPLNDFYANKLQQDHTAAAVKVLSLPSSTQTADRTSCLLSLPVALGGFGFRSIIRTLAHKAVGGLHRFCHAKHKILAQALRLSLHRFLIPSSGIPRVGLTDDQQSARTTSVIYGRLRFMRDRGYEAHAGGMSMHPDAPTMSSESISRTYFLRLIKLFTFRVTVP